MSRASAKIGCFVPDVAVGGARFRSTPPVDMGPSSTVALDRVLNQKEIRDVLPDVIAPMTTIRLCFLCDLSGSMTGSHDVVGVRHEASLIAVEHIAARQHRRARWELEILSFDLNSPLDRATFTLDRRGLNTASEAFLSKPYGGSSNLGPSLDQTEQFSGPQVIVVLSDFELFDVNVTAVLDRLINSTALEVLALVFTSQPPSKLLDTRVQVNHINPVSTSPADVARHIVEAANVAASATRRT